MDDDPDVVGRPGRPARRAVLGAAGALATGAVAAAVAGGGQRAGAQERGTSLFVVVTEFGATGDGSTDDSEAVVAALERALEISARTNADVPISERHAGPVVFFPAGIYRCPGLAQAPPLDWPLSVRGDGGAVLDQARPDDGDRGADAVLRCRAALDVEGLVLVRGGRWFDFRDPHPDGADVRYPQVRMVGCRILDSAAPLWGTAATNPVDRLVISGNEVRGSGGRRSRSAGFVFATRGYRSVSVTGNHVEDVLQYGIRIGADPADDDPDPYRDQVDVVCSSNTVRGVWQDEGRSEASTNGIRVQGRRVVLAANAISDVSNGDESQVEGIYVKGSGVVIEGNALLDAGRAQGQIVVKASDALVSGNRVEFVDARRGNGIRVEGSHVQVLGNEVVNPPPGFQGISLDGRAGSTTVVAGNIVRSGTPERAIVTDARRSVVVRDNTLLDLTVGAEGIGVRAQSVDGAPGTVEQVVVTGNVFVNCRSANGNGYCVRLAAGDESTMGTAVVKGNTFQSTVGALRLERADTASFERVVVHGNTYVDVDGRISNPGVVPTALQDHG